MKKQYLTVFKSIHLHQYKDLLEITYNTLKVTIFYWLSVARQGLIVLATPASINMKYHIPWEKWFLFNMELMEKYLDTTLWIKQSNYHVKIILCNSANTAIIILKVDNNYTIDLINL